MENAFKDLKRVQRFKGSKALRLLKKVHMLNVFEAFNKFNRLKSTAYDIVTNLLKILKHCLNNSAVLESFIN